MRSILLAAVVFGAASVGNQVVGQQQPEQDEKQEEIVLRLDGIDPQQKASLEIPGSNNVTLTGKDGFAISATYYPGLLGKKTPALILLHDLGGSASDLKPLAEWLQANYGYAVIVPDLRGHGSSKPNDGDYDPMRMSGEEFASIANDIEACKIYLRDRNNEGELNIDLLMVVAVGKSNILAVEWTAVDWSYPMVKGIRQGQDVKSLVMISPEQSHKGIKMNSLKTPLFNGRDADKIGIKPLPVLIGVAGSDRNLLRDAESIESSLSRGRTDEEGADKEVYCIKNLANNGAQISNPDNGDFSSIIAEFAFFTLYQKAGEHGWQIRGQK